MSYFSDLCSVSNPYEMFSMGPRSTTIKGDDGDRIADNVKYRRCRQGNNDLLVVGPRVFESPISDIEWAATYKDGEFALYLGHSPQEILEIARSGGQFPDASFHKFEKAKYEGVTLMLALESYGIKWKR